MPRKKNPPNNKSVSQLGNVTDITDIVKTKQKRNRPDLANWGQENVQPGDNAKFLEFATQFMDLPKLDFNDIPSVKERIAFYYKQCHEFDIKPGVAGLANALGVDRKTLWEWKTGGRRADNTELADIIKKNYILLENLWEYYMEHGKINPASGIFIGKNHFELADQTQIVVTPNNPMQNVDTGTASKRMIESMPDDE